MKCKTCNGSGSLARKCTHSTSYDCYINGCHEKPLKKCKQCNGWGFVGFKPEEFINFLKNLEYDIHHQDSKEKLRVWIKRIKEGKEEV